MRTVGRQQAKRFLAAAKLSPPERESVIRFLDDMAQEIEVSHEAWAGSGDVGPPPIQRAGLVKEDRQPVPVVCMHQREEQHEVEQQVHGHHVRE